MEIPLTITQWLTTIFSVVFNNFSSEWVCWQSSGLFVPPSNNTTEPHESCAFRFHGMTKYRSTINCFVRLRPMGAKQIIENRMLDRDRFLEEFRILSSTPCRVQIEGSVSNSGRLIGQGGDCRADHTTTTSLVKPVLTLTLETLLRTSIASASWQRDHQFLAAL